MNVGWIIDMDEFDPSCKELAEAVKRNGHSVVFPVRPKPPYGWADTGNAYRSAFPRGACVVTSGGIDLVLRIRNDNLWTPGVFASVDRFFCSHYYSHYGRFLLNRDYIMLPYAELPRCRDFLFDTLGRNDVVFIRPDSPLKLFTGMTVNRSTFDRDFEFMGFYDFPIESMVVVSSPKTIVAEWRFLVADGKIVTGSQYIERDQRVSRIADDSGALDFANTVVESGYEPDPVWVLDVCKTANNQYHLLEVGGFSFAGLYACDKDAVVQAVSAVALRIHKAKQG